MQFVGNFLASYTHFVYAIYQSVFQLVPQKGHPRQHFLSKSLTGIDAVYMQDFFGNLFVFCLH